MTEEKHIPIGTKIIPRIIQDEVKQAYLDYSMSVIVGRALPDVRDGLKPVHRRVLYAMNELGLKHNQSFKKSARVVGEVLGKYHPHSDVAVYDTLVRLAQNFSMRYTLVDGQGNYGCFTGDTKVKLKDDRNLSFVELIEEQKQGKKNFTFTVDEKGFIKIAEIKNPRLTKKNAEIMKVVLDNAEEIRCTLNHKFMLRDGNYKEAKDLLPNDSLMPTCSWISEEFLLQEVVNNHKVTKIEFLEEFADVYDLSIEHTHNFALSAGIFVHNSIDGDPPAAMRYTECRLTKLAEQMLEDIDKKTVRVMPNFDNSTTEPTVLPSKLPNLLINGGSGIAVGMATNLPPNNIGEIIDATIKQIENPEISIEEIMNIVHGPDFPTGGIICGTNGIKEAYHTGRGKIIVRAKSIFEQDGKDKNKSIIIVNEIPFMVNKSELLEEIADLVRDKKINGVSDLRDESDRNGIRVVIELKRDAEPNIVLNQLFKHTRMQTTFGVIMLVLVNNEPKILNIKQLIYYYIEHRKNVVRKRTLFELNKAQIKEHVLEGLTIALANIKDVIKIIRESRTVDDARNALGSNFNLTIEQTNSILDMKLQRLTSLEHEKIKQERIDLLKMIEEFKFVLVNPSKILEIIKNELSEIKNVYDDARRTQIADQRGMVLESEDLIKDEEMLITISASGYIKRLPLQTYKLQHRAGKGVIATTTKGEDIVKHLFVARTHSYILFFTNKGNVHWIKVYNLPEASRQARGKAIINIVELKNDEYVTAYVPVLDFNSQGYLVMATKKGTVKKTELMAYSNPRKHGIIAITLEEGDELINVELTNGNSNVTIATKNGSSVRFDEMKIRKSGRSSKGVIGIRLKNDDEVIGMITTPKSVIDKSTLLVVTENGYGKRTYVSEYRLTSRGGSGVISIQKSQRNGNVVSICSITDDYDVMFISKNGSIIRVPSSEIKIISRNTQGVKLMKLKSDDKIVSAIRVPQEDESDSKLK